MLRHKPFINKFRPTPEGLSDSLVNGYEFSNKQTRIASESSSVPCDQSLAIGGSSSNTPKFTAASQRRRQSVELRFQRLEPANATIAASDTMMRRRWHIIGEPDVAAMRSHIQACTKPISGSASVLTFCELAFDDGVRFDVESAASTCDQSQALTESSNHSLLSLSDEPWLETPQWSQVEPQSAAASRLCLINASPLTQTAGQSHHCESGQAGVAPGPARRHSHAYPTRPRRPTVKFPLWGAPVLDAGKTSSNRNQMHSDCQVSE